MTDTIEATGVHTTPARERPTTTYRGRVCCRFCRDGLGRGRTAINHLLEVHPSVIADDFRGREDR